jgi:hypothetical protein
VPNPVEQFFLTILVSCVAIICGIALECFAGQTPRETHQRDKKMTRGNAIKMTVCCLILTAGGGIATYFDVLVPAPAPSATPAPYSSYSSFSSFPTTSAPTLSPAPASSFPPALEVALGSAAGLLITALAYLLVSRLSRAEMTESMIQAEDPPAGGGQDTTGRIARTMHKFRGMASALFLWVSSISSSHINRLMGAGMALIVVAITFAVGFLIQITDKQVLFGASETLQVPYKDIVEWPVTTTSQGCDPTYLALHGTCPWAPSHACHNYDFGFACYAKSVNVSIDHKGVVTAPKVCKAAIPSNSFLSSDMNSSNVTRVQNASVVCQDHCRNQLQNEAISLHSGMIFLLANLMLGASYFILQACQYSIFGDQTQTHFRTALFNRFNSGWRACWVEGLVPFLKSRLPKCLVSCCWLSATGTQEDATTIAPTRSIDGALVVGCCFRNLKTGLQCLQVYVQTLLAWGFTTLFTVVLSPAYVLVSCISLGYSCWVFWAVHFSSGWRACWVEGLAPFLKSRLPKCFFSKPTNTDNTVPMLSPVEQMANQIPSATFSDRSHRWSVIFFIAADLSALCKYSITVYNMALRLEPSYLINCTPVGDSKKTFSLQAYFVKGACEATIDVTETLKMWEFSAFALSALFVIVSIVNISKRVIGTSGSVESALAQLDIPEQEAESFIGALEEMKSKMRKCRSVDVILAKKSKDELASMMTEHIPFEERTDILTERCAKIAMKVFNFYQKHAVKTIPEFLIFIFETVGSDTTDSEKVRSEICRKTKLEMKHRLLENTSGARVFEGKSITELKKLGFPEDGVLALRCKTYFECTADGQNFRVHFRDFDQLNFGGRIQSGDTIKCICCFPGMYETEWRESAGSICSACVFYESSSESFGKHSCPIDQMCGETELQVGECYCKYLYSERQREQWGDGGVAPWGKSQTRQSGGAHHSVLVFAVQVAGGLRRGWPIATRLVTWGTSLLLCTKGRGIVVARRIALVHSKVQGHLIWRTALAALSSPC